MAQKVLVELVDDLDGGVAHHAAYQFGLDGVSYEIDLSEENVSALEGALAPFVAHARRTGGRKRSGGTASGTGDKAATSQGASAGEIRKWLQKNEYDIADRGRIPETMLEAYANANRDLRQTPVVTPAPEPEPEPEPEAEAPAAKSTTRKSTARSGGRKTSGRTSGRTSAKATKSDTEARAA